MADSGRRECLIFWYSGTGNSYLIAEKLAQTISGAGIPVTLVQIKKGLRAEIPVDALIGLVFPVAAAGTYPFIWDFFESLPPAENQVFMVDTLGAYSGGIKGPLAKCLKEKGYQPLAAAEIIMPENFPPGRKYNEEDNRNRVAKGLDQIAPFVEKLLAGEGQWHDVPVFSALLGLMCRFRAPWSTMRKIFSFRVEQKSCTKCGLCLKLCPIGNIETDKNGFARLKDGCQSCMRCVACCPARAILSKRGNGMDYRAVNAEKLLCDKRKF